MIEVNYAGKNITNGVSINRCVHDMYAEGRTDTLTLIFNDDKHVWDSWGVKTNDEISVAYGPIKTGKMYVFRAKPRNGLFEIVATAAPASFKDRKNKAWQKIRLKDMGREIAGNHGLDFAAYGVDDVLYPYILQSNESDFSFLNRRCALEGCAFLVYDGTLVMYSQRYIENQTASESIHVGIDSDYEYNDKSGWLFGSCRIERGAYKGSFEAGNGSNKCYVPPFDFTVTSDAEAGRYARNMLRMVNKGALSGYIHSNVLTGYAAGSMAKLSNGRAPSWDGDVFLTHIRNDYGRGKSKLFFRKPIEGGY